MAPTQDESQNNENSDLTNLHIIMGQSSNGKSYKDLKKDYDDAVK